MLDATPEHRKTTIVVAAQLDFLFEELAITDFVGFSPCTGPLDARVPHLIASVFTRCLFLLTTTSKTGTSAPGS